MHRETSTMSGAGFRWLFSSGSGSGNRLITRWIVLRALGLIYFSAFFSLLFQARGMIGPKGILPADRYLESLSRSLGPATRIWFAPTLLWLSSGSHMLLALCWIGMAAGVLAALNLWPHLTLLSCFLCFLSYVAALQVFSDFQSDGMLLEAGFLALFFAPKGFWPGLGRTSLPSRASLFLLQWEWFRIYFESGLVKLLSGDPEWRHLTALDNYYQNCPLPTWIGWYIQHWPHWFQVATAGATLVMELVLVWMLFLPRTFRIICFFLVTAWQIGVILTANYTFLNYLVLALGFLLLDDRFFRSCAVKLRLTRQPASAPAPTSVTAVEGAKEGTWEGHGKKAGGFRHALRGVGLAASAFVLCWIGYVTVVELIELPWPNSGPPSWPVEALSPFRIANQYGLFAWMTRGRYEIEFQGSRDGETWTAYPFRYKPQALNLAPGIYAPYQPRFEWNLWFASLASWQQYPMVPATELRLLENDPAVLELFKSDPFPGSPPTMVRAVLYQYWFTTRAEKRATGNWWKRKLLGLYAPELGRLPDGRIGIFGIPGELPPHN